MIKINDAEVKIILGDITESQTDALVYAANPHLSMEVGLGKVIREKSGPSLEVEARKYCPVDMAAAVGTAAGTLKARFVIHAVMITEDGRTDEHKIRKATASALRCAAHLQVRTLAFPALGCGVSGFPAVGSAKIMIQEVLKFFRFQNSTIKNVVFCLADEETFNIFHKTIPGYVQHILHDMGKGPYVTVDIIIEREDGIVMIERSNPPYGWALPGGFVDYGETLEESAIREAKEETHLDLENLRQFHTYSAPDRDPRFHTVSTVFVAKGIGIPRWGDDAKGLTIVPYDQLLNREYAFDHKRVVEDYLHWAKRP
jgi:ADP-ribose pyrophosphatase YjhB (NUDIX family)/O-acetyl-ADP-ribose deacetylase (regulator of RNase III)